MAHRSSSLLSANLSAGQAQAEARCGGLLVAAAVGAGAFPEPGVLPVFAPDRGFDIGEIRLDLTIAPDKGTLLGQAQVDVLPLPAGLGRVVLDLDDVQVD
ncbi:MAG: M1 family metallopeptidase, partial [Oligoflexia bacterium]|nr:M1 family metallopeptidase [Oligoflexia bacterium]